MLKLTLTEISKYVSSCLCNLIITCYQNVLQKNYISAFVHYIKNEVHLQHKGSWK